MRGGTKEESRASLRLRPWTEGRRRMEERAAAVGSAFKADFFGRASSGSRQMLQKENGVSGLVVHEESMLTQASITGQAELNMRARAWAACLKGWWW
jgi:hypothetical protein